MRAEIIIPPLLNCGGPSVALQQAEVANSVLWAVTTRDRGGHRRDKWFGEEAQALAYAVQVADGLGLLLLDLRDPGGAE